MLSVPEHTILALYTPRQPLQKVLSPVADALLGVACSSRSPRALSPPAAGLSRHIPRHEQLAERALVAGVELVFASVVPPLHRVTLRYDETVGVKQLPRDLRIPAAPSHSDL